MSKKLKTGVRKERVAVRSTGLVRTRRFPIRKPGEPVKLNWTKQILRAACCDCALVHNVEFVIKGNTLILRAWRNERLTKHFRKLTGKDAWGM